MPGLGHSTKQAFKKRCGAYIHTHTHTHTHTLYMCLYTYMCIYTNTMRYYSATKQNEIMPFAAMWMGLEIIILSEISKKEKDKWYHLYVESEIWPKWTYLWNRNRLIDTAGVKAEGGGRRGMGWEFGISRHKLVHIEWISNKALLQGTGNCIQCAVISSRGKDKNLWVVCLTRTPYPRSSSIKGMFAHV